MSDAGRAVLADVCRRYGIAELAVFGSVARGEATDASDIDITYVLAPGRRLGWEIEDLADELSAVFGRRVDLVSRRALHPRIASQVIAESRVLYAA
ncbi:MAG: nucleotidyltransferase family protein [Candidatus Nanopelagicales bacterium]